MRTETRTMVGHSSGLRNPVVQRGPRWVFDLWHQGRHRCSARTAQGGQCRRYVNLQAGVSRYCERHRDESEPVYYLQSTQREEPCPCGCGYAVTALVLEAALIAGHTRREQAVWAIDSDGPLLRKTS
jgi:hypothetical protein